MQLAARTNHRSVDEFLASPDAEEWIALAEREQDHCPKHGGPLSECGDAERDWYPQRSVCYPAMQLAAVNAMYDDLHKDRPFHDGTETVWQEKRSRLTPFHYRDGMSLWLSPEDLTPLDDFLGQNVRRDPGAGGNQPGA